MNRPSRWPVAAAFLVLGLGLGMYANNRLQGQNPLPVVPPEMTSFRDTVKRVLPAVVSIETKVKARKVDAVRVRPQVGELPPGVPEEFRRFFEGMEDGRELPDVPSSGFGSGFVVDPTGVILTNYHVIAGAESVEVQLQDGRKFTTKDIRGDKKTDLAIVRIDTKDPLPFLEFGDSDKMEVGDRVLAIGAPFGLTGSVTNGIISAKSRDLRMNIYEDFLQTDAAINPGNSGGPLVSLDGKVIGINSAIKSRSGGFQGVGLAISSNLSRQVKDQLLRDGVVRRGYLGVQIKDLAPDVAKALGVANGGVVIARVMPNTPADKGGLQAGDVVTTIGGRAVRDGRELQKVVAAMPLNQPTDVAIVRDGQPLVVKLNVEEQPEAFGSERVPAPVPSKKESAAISLESFGLSVTDFTAEIADQLGFKQAFSGAMVVRVESGSAADQAGLAKNMVIVRVDGKPIDSAATLREALTQASAEKGALLQVRSATGGTDFLLMQVPK